MIFQPEDRAIHHDIMLSFHNQGERTRAMGELMLAVGHYFLGFPYASHTLEREGRETLVINLRELDCFTFVENVVALAGLICKGKSAFRNYAAQLKKMRYRSGILRGYSSRLHYFSDWLNDNEKKGIVIDVTRRAGGEAFRKYFNFMTRHREDYPALSREKFHRDMMAIEKRLSGRWLHYIPKAALGKFEHMVENGDLIAVTTDIEGLDVIHVGLAVSLRSRLHLLHASEVEKRVVISDLTLHQYLSRRKVMTGIMVGRAITAYQNDGSPSLA
ncbi:MAG TPA: N-acetylmuramoyl-L-alanine amidase-like domain-containing protein [Syntrophales bacterium]